METEKKTFRVSAKIPGMRGTTFVDCFLAETEERARCPANLVKVAQIAAESVA